MRVKLILHGALQEYAPAEFECEAATAAEAINAVFQQHPLPVLNAHQRRWTLSVPGFDSEIALKSPLEVQELHLVPALMGGGGGGNGGFMKIAIGAVLIVAGLVLTFGSYGSASALGIPLIMSGISFALGGIIELLTPAPKTNTGVHETDNKNPEESRYLGAAKNTTSASTRIPIGYGRFKLHGQILSFDVEADPIAVLGQPPRSDQRRRVGRT